MRKIIGGLLVVSLFSRPALLNVTYFAYQILKTQNQIICVIKKDNGEEIVESKDIDAALNEIENNKRTINSLLKEKKKLITKVQSFMDLFSHTKKSLKENQIQSFVSFIDLYQKDNAVLQNTLIKLDENQELTQVKKEFFKKNSNRSFIFNKLRKIINYQLEAIRILQNIIFMARNTIDVF